MNGIGGRDAPDSVKGVEREVSSGERNKVGRGELRAGGKERAHELHGEVPPVHDAAREECRDQYHTVQPLRCTARVPRLVEESNMRGRASGEGKKGKGKAGARVSRSGAYHHGRSRTGGC